MKLVDKIMTDYAGEELVFANGFDRAVLGIEMDSLRIIYSVKKCIHILMRSGDMDHHEALDFFDSKIANVDLGPKTPIWCDDLV
jgi:hypothetical protein